MKYALIALMSAAAVTISASPSWADDRAVVENFYKEILGKASTAGLGERASVVLAPAWESLGDYSGIAKKRDQFVAQVEGFGKLIPDLKWNIEEVLQQGNRYVVRGRATGTPSGPFFGAPHTGKRFDIMSIDIHTVENGKIVRSFHVEDWGTALRQLKAN